MPTIRAKLQRHSRRRAAARFQLTLVHRDFVEISKKIINAKKGPRLEESRSEVVPLKKLTCTRTFCAVYHKDMWLPLIYSNSQQSVVTILPKNRLGPYQHLLDQARSAAKAKK